MLIKPKLPVPVIQVGLAFLLTSCLFYGFVSIPSDLDQPDVLFWMYAKGKVATGLSWLGGFLGLGHPATIYRNLVSHLDESVGYNYTLRENINITDTAFNGVDVRLYQPNNMVRNGPAIIFFHDGHWISGSLDSHDHVACSLAKGLGLIVVSVDYRLAPEHPYPVPFDDCYVATTYFMANASKFSVDRSKITVMGIGAGGNLAAAVSLKLRDDKQKQAPMPEFQVLINPLLQAFDFSTPSFYQNQYDAIMPKFLAVNSWLWYALGWEAHRKYGSSAMKNSHTSPSAKQSKMAANVNHNLLHRKFLHESYMPNTVDFGEENVWNDLKNVFSDPYFSPLMTGNLKNLPKTYMVSCQYHVARDDALMYGKRLEKSGTPTKMVHYDRGVHGILSTSQRINLADNILKDLIDFLIKHL